MNLEEFTSPLPKPWLNINANSVSANELSGGVVSSIVPLYLGTVAAYGTPAVTLTSSNIVGGVGAFNAGSAQNVSLPTGSVLSTFIGAQPFPYYFVFKVYTAALSPTTFNTNTGIALYDGGSSFVVPASVQHDLVFFNGLSGWVIYH